MSSRAPARTTSISDASRPSSRTRRRAIDRASAIKRCHTTAKKSIDQAAEQVAALTCEVQEALDAVAEELAEDPALTRPRSDDSE